MIIQFYTPGVLLQCSECKHIKVCKDGQRNPTATHCRSGEGTAKAEKARVALQLQLTNRESITIK